MNRLLKSINKFLYNDFIFSPRFRIWRHVIYWIVHTFMWATLWMEVGSPSSYGSHLVDMLVWLPVFIVYGYPMAYWAVPRLLLKGKLLQFILVILAWGAAGLYIDTWYKDYVFIPVQEALHMEFIAPKGPQAWCYLCVTTAASVPMVIKFFKFWDIKRQDWLQAQQEKIIAELQLLKAQVHPHFLFNTLNNIYSYSLENSSKTPGLILKLSSLLSYMLYDCKGAEVRVEKELEVMKNYIELERERYGDKIDISWSVEGEIKDKFIAPLMMLPFLENAFKHGTSEQIERSWLSVDVSVIDNTLKAKITNSKNENVKYRENGIGIANVKKRLQFIYPGKHELKFSDEGLFFVVALVIRLEGDDMQVDSYPPGAPAPNVFVMKTINHETALPTH